MSTSPASPHRNPTRPSTLRLHQRRRRRTARASWPACPALTALSTSRPQARRLASSRRRHPSPLPIGSRRPRRRSTRSHGPTSNSARPRQRRRWPVHPASRCATTSTTLSPQLQRQTCRRLWTGTSSSRRRQRSTRRWILSHLRLATAAVSGAPRSEPNRRRLTVSSFPRRTTARRHLPSPSLAFDVHPLLLVLPVNSSHPSLVVLSLEVDTQLQPGFSFCPSRRLPARQLRESGSCEAWFDELDSASLSSPSPRRRPASGSANSVARSVLERASNNKQSTDHRRVRSWLALLAGSASTDLGCVLDPSERERMAPKDVGKEARRKDRRQARALTALLCAAHKHGAQASRDE